jgi:predicted O-methyltransferase YrrM
LGIPIHSLSPVHYFCSLYNLFTLSARYLKYFLTSSSGKGHGVHSPFVFDFVINVLNDKTRLQDFDKIEALRASLLKQDEKITVEDFGAGSALDPSRERKIRDIARHAAKPAKYGRLLHRVIEHYQCRNILELGTSLGLSTSYMAAAPSAQKVVTLEGSENIANKAIQNFTALTLHNIEIITGNFDHTLDAVLKNHPKPDFIFFDGNHRKEPTLRYFRQCLAGATENDIFIFDDIHWSAEMEEAWREICKTQAVTCSIDLFFVGIVFFRKDFREKQAFTIRY